MLVRTAEYFLRERHVEPCSVRFDVITIDNVPGLPPIERLHKAARSPVPGRTTSSRKRRVALRAWLRTSEASSSQFRKQTSAPPSNASLEAQGKRVGPKGEEKNRNLGTMKFID
jgi:hypothetical protein